MRHDRSGPIARQTRLSGFKLGKDGKLRRANKPRNASEAIAQRKSKRQRPMRPGQADLRARDA